MRRTYAFSDLHGNYNLWKQIKNYVNKEDTLICCGDCADRGAKGFDIIKEVLARPNTIYLKGNHEDLLVRGMREHFRGFATGSDNQYVWFMNGGYDTYIDICNMSTQCQLDFVHMMEKLPLSYIYVNKNEETIYLSHAGTSFDPDYVPDLLWDRNHFQKLYDADLETIQVHGHTPTFSGLIGGTRGEIFKYCNGKKINIDLGTATTKKAALLDLDTLEPIYFEEDEFFE